MDGITKITERIMAEASAACAEVSEKAARRCDAIRAEYEQKADAAYENAMNKGRTEIDLAAQKYVRNSQINSRKELLSLKQEMIDSVFAAAREKILGMPEDEYTAWLVKLIAEASGSGDEEVILDPRDASKGESIVEKANAALTAAGKPAYLKLGEISREIGGGVVLHKGNIETNCTLDAILEQYRKELASKVAQILFE